MSDQSIELNKEEAIQLLELRGDDLMKSNPNWHVISVIENKAGKGYSYLIRVYDLEEENEHIKSAKNGRISESDAKGEVKFSLPVLVGFGQSRIISEIKSGSFPQVRVSFTVEQVSIDTERGAVQELDEDELPDKRVMGHILDGVGSPSGEGALGGVFLGSDDQFYAVTAFHVVGDINSPNCPDNPIVVNSPVAGNNVTRLGEVVWCEYGPYLDIAIIRFDDPNYVGRGSLCPGFQVKGMLDDVPEKGQLVKICSSQAIGKIKKGKVTSDFTFKRLAFKSDSVCKRLVETTIRAVPGDSGSLVLNKQDRVVGLMVKDLGVKISYFLPLDILRNTISVRTGRSIDNIHIKEIL